MAGGFATYCGGGSCEDWHWIWINWTRRKIDRRRYNGLATWVESSLEGYRPWRSHHRWTRGRREDPGLGTILVVTKAGGVRGMVEVPVSNQVKATGRVWRYWAGFKAPGLHNRVSNKVMATGMVWRYWARFKAPGPHSRVSNKVMATAGYEGTELGLRPLCHTVGYPTR